MRIPLDEQPRDHADAMQGIDDSSTQQSQADLGSGKRSESDWAAAQKRARHEAASSAHRSQRCKDNRAGNIAASKLLDAVRKHPGVGVALRTMYPVLHTDRRVRCSICGGALSEAYVQVHTCKGRARQHPGGNHAGLRRMQAAHAAHANG